MGDFTNNPDYDLNAGKMDLLVNPHGPRSLGFTPQQMSQLTQLIQEQT